MRKTDEKTQNTAEENRAENYAILKAIMNTFDGVTLRERKNGSFRFPFYLYEWMNGADIGELDLSQRAYNSLKRGGLQTIGGLAEAAADGQSLKKLRNCGAKSRAEIMEKLFLCQLVSLRPQAREAYLKTVIEMNRR